jgi:hypothetical protein
MNRTLGEPTGEPPTGLALKQGQGNRDSRSQPRLIQDGLPRLR